MAFSRRSREHISTQHVKQTAKLPMDPSRDADEIHRKKQPTEIVSGRDASGTLNQRTQNYKSQISSELMPSFYEPPYLNQGLGVHSSTPRGAESPSVTPKNTHERNERTMIRTWERKCF